MGVLRAADPDEPVVAVHAGLVRYARAWAWQRDLAARRAEDAVPDLLLTLEHERVYTAGRRSDPSHVLFDAAQRAARGIDFHEIDRGGDVTYHGPGQLVAYPIVRLHSLSGVLAYVRALEEVCVRVAADFGVRAHPVAGLTGVWVGACKLAAIGVRVGRGRVTSHGLALNVTTDLADFDGIVPCGIPDRGVCSLASLGVDATVADVLARFRARFAEVVGCPLEPAGMERLGVAAAADDLVGTGGAA